MNTEILKGLKKEAADLRERKSLARTPMNPNDVSKIIWGSPEKKDEIIILAMGPTRMMCPWDAEVWGLNNGYRQVIKMGGRLDKIFLAHLQEHYMDDGTEIFDWDEINQLQAAGIDVINTHRVKKLNSRLYPFKRITRKFKTEFFSNTIAYQLAYMLDKNTIADKKTGKLKLKPDGWKRLRIYGADMVTMGEYQLEKGSVEFWCGIAKGLGMDVEVANGSCLMRTATGKPYGAKRIDYRAVDPFNLLKKQVALEKGVKDTEVLDHLSLEELSQLTRQA